jgi:pimeloyl-ACP methyl ester carboxylesterase
LPSTHVCAAEIGRDGKGDDVNYLGERIGGDTLQLVALDWRGRGRSERTPAGTYGWENHALDVLAVAGALGYQTFAVIGQSMGGSVAMKIA